MHIPIREDPEPEQCIQIIVSYRASATEELLRPVKYSLAECHNCGRKSYNWCTWRLLHMLKVEVKQVAERFNNVKECWREMRIVLVDFRRKRKKQTCIVHLQIHHLVHKPPRRRRNQLPGRASMVSKSNADHHL